ncbi:MAG: TolC family protein [Saprospiraceae bacterium]|nr:TolC family protein [Saprospiraceae bacterium]
MKTYISVILVLFSSVTWTQHKSLSMDQCIELAHKNNISLQQSLLAVSVGKINNEQAIANLLPNLNGSIGYGYNQGRAVNPITNNYINTELSSSNIGFGSQVILYNGLKLQNLIQQSKHNFNAAQMDAQQQKDNLTLNVMLAFIQVLNAEDILALSIVQSQTTKKRLEETEIRVREAAVGNYILSELKGQYAIEKTGILDGENRIKLARLTLFQLMNVPNDDGITLQRSADEKNLSPYLMLPDQIYEAAINRMAVIKSGEYRIKSAEKSIAITKADAYPQLSLNTSIGSNYSTLARKLTPLDVKEQQTGDYVLVNNIQNPVLRQSQNYSESNVSYLKQLNNNLGIYVGLNLQIPIFNNLQVANKTKLAKIALDNTVLAYDNTKQILRQNINVAWLNMNNSFEKLALLTEQVGHFEESFRAANIRLNEGVINLSEYLISKNNLDSAKLNLSQTTYDYMFRTRILDFYAGGM